MPGSLLRQKSQRWGYSCCIFQDPSLLFLLPTQQVPLSLKSHFQGTSFQIIGSRHLSVSQDNSFHMVYYYTIQPQTGLYVLSVPSETFPRRTERVFSMKPLTCKQAQVSYFSVAAQAWSQHLSPNHYMNKYANWHRYAERQLGRGQIILLQALFPIHHLHPRTHQEKTPALFDSTQKNTRQLRYGQGQREDNGQSIWSKYCCQ